MFYSTFTFSCMSWNSLSGRIYPWTYDFYIVAFVNSFFYWWSFSKVNLFFEMLVFLVKQFWYCFIYYSNYSLSIISFVAFCFFMYLCILPSFFFYMEKNVFQFQFLSFCLNIFSHFSIIFHELRIFHSITFLSYFRINDLH